MKLQTKIKILNSKNISNIRNDNSMNNISGISRMMKSKANSTIYSISQDDLENNTKYKFDEFNNIYKDNINEENINENKNITMSTFKSSSRNYNYFTILNKKANKKNNMSQQNSLINIKPYSKKNFSTNNLRKNNSKKNGRNNSINLSNKRKDIKKKIQSNSFMNITSNTFNLNKNNIMINLNPKNVNMSIENLKVKKKLHEYQKLIDQKLNQLIKKNHPYSKINKTVLHIHRNSSPSLDKNIKNSQQKNSPILGLDFYIKKIKKKNITVNSNHNNDIGNKNNNSTKIISKSIIDSKREKNIRKNKSNSKNINNMKLNLNKVNSNSKVGELNSSRQINESMLTNEQSKLSLKKYIFAKCTNPLSNTIKC